MSLKWQCDFDKTCGSLSFFFWPCCVTCGIFQWLGIKPAFPEFEAQSLNHWIARKVPYLSFCPLAFNHLSFVNDTLFSFYKIPFSTTWVGSGVELVTWPVLYLSHWYIVQFLGKELLVISFLIHTKNATLMSVI